MLLWSIVISSINNPIVIYLSIIVPYFMLLYDVVEFLNKWNFSKMKS